MRSKKWLVIITGVISIVTVVCAYWFCDVADNEFLKNFFFAIMGSALLGVIMSLTEYYVARKQALEKYYLTAYDILKEIKKVEYFFADEPMNLIESYFLEEQNSRHMRVIGKEPETTAKSNLLNYMIAKWKKTDDIPEDIFQEYAEQKFASQVADYQRSVLAVIDSYIAVSKIDFRPLENAYGDLDFFIANRTLRKNIYEGIHQALRNYIHEAAQKAYHFNLYLSKNSNNFAVLIEMVDELQKMYFSVDDQLNGNYSIITIRRKFADSIDDKIEELRCKIYMQKCHNIEHFPVAEFFILRKSMGPNVILRKE